MTAKEIGFTPGHELAKQSASRHVPRVDVMASVLDRIGVGSRLWTRNPSSFTTRRFVQRGSPRPRSTEASIAVLSPRRVVAMTDVAHEGRSDDFWVSRFRESYT